MAGFGQIGVVEGFYGRVWSEAEREGFITALLPFGLNTYLYCPKHEPALAAEVMRPLTEEEGGRLGRLAAFCADRRIALWAGLHLEPPLNVGDSQHIDATARKCLALAELGVSGFAVQFDDLTCAFDPATAYDGSLARLQAHAVEQVFTRARLLGVQADWLVVPALYSLDPLLENTYGPFEPAYLSVLDARLPEAVAWMFTGPRVCSPAVTLADLEAWRGPAKREVVLWDNYPVNDAAMANNLHLAPLTGRAGDLPEGIRGYLFNPLMQPALGVVPGATCLIYANDPGGYSHEEAWRQSLESHLPPPAGGLFTELEALTRQCCLTEFLPERMAGNRGTLAGKLEKAWQDMRGGGSIGGSGGKAGGNVTANRTAGKSATRALGRFLTEVKESLPPAMLEDAGPWLARLRQAQAVFAARSDSSDWHGAAAPYRQGKATVLGEWFRP